MDGRRHQVLDHRGYDGVEDFQGGEEGWSGWGQKIRVLTKPMCDELVELLAGAEKSPGKPWTEVLAEAEAAAGGDATQEQREVLKKASSELYSLLVRKTKGDAALVVEKVTSLDGVEAWGRLHQKYSQKTMGRMFRLQRECMYPRAVKKLDEVENAVMEWEKKWRRMEANLGKDIKIPDLMRMAALMEIFPKNIQEQFLLRVDELGEDYAAVPNKMLKHALNTVE